LGEPAEELCEEQEEDYRLEKREEEQNWVAWSFLIALVNRYQVSVIIDSLSYLLRNISMDDVCVFSSSGLILLTFP
jgi:hypothetical protein